MPKKVQKTLQEYLAKVKSPRHPQIQSAFNSLTSSKNWFLAACKHPKTPSIAFDQSPGGSSGSGSSSKTKNNNSPNNKDNDAATLADVDRFLYENFKSLYFRDHDDDGDEVEETENNKNTNPKRASSLEEIQNEEEEAPKVGGAPINMFESPRLLETPRDLICGSTRFFVKPVLSGSLLIDDGAASSPNSTVTNNTDSMMSNNANENHHHQHHNHFHHDHHHQNQTLPNNCIALLASSSSPYEDFKRSMQEVVEARSKKQGMRGVIDWDFMEELLFCYLDLNEKKSHKFILSAYVDVVAAMRRNLETAVPGMPRSVRTFRIAGTR